MVAHRKFADSGNSELIIHEFVRKTHILELKIK